MKAELRQQPKIYNDPLVSSRDSFFRVLIDQYVGNIQISSTWSGMLYSIVVCYSQDPQTI